jgi:hypothetical protein
MAPAVRLAAVGYPIAVSSDGSDRVSQRWQLTPDPVSARVARRLIHSVCEDWAVHDQACYDALVVVTELVTNVVEHAGTECQLTVSIGGEGLRIEVRDFNQSRPPRPRPSSIWPARGQGLRVVALLSSQWGVTELDDGKSLWAICRSPHPRKHDGRAKPPHDPADGLDRPPRHRHPHSTATGTPTVRLLLPTWLELVRAVLPADARERLM